MQVAPRLGWRSPRWARRRTDQDRRPDDEAVRTASGREATSSWSKTSRDYAHETQDEGTCGASARHERGRARRLARAPPTAPSSAGCRFRAGHGASLEQLPGDGGGERAPAQEVVGRLMMASRYG